MKYFFHTLIFFFLVMKICFAQWVQTNGPDDGNISSLLVSGSNIFAGTSFWEPLGNLYISTDNGTIWEQTGLTNTNVRALAVSDTNLFAGTDDGIFLSTDNGTTWIQVNTGLPPYMHVLTLAVCDANLFLGTEAWGGAFLSTNNGTTWTQVGSGLSATYILDFAIIGENLFAGTDAGVFLTTNNGNSWTAVNSGLTNTYFIHLAVIGTNLFAGSWGGGVFRSTDNGISWWSVNSGLTDLLINSFAVSDFALFAGTHSSGVFLSTNDGGNWTEVNSGLNSGVLCLAINESYLFVGGGYGDGVWRRPLSEMITTVENTPAVSTTFNLEQNYPNPFNPTTTIRFSIQNKSNVKITILNAIGEEVAVVLNEEKEAGFHQVEFNAANLPSGVYFYQLRAGEFIQTKKMVLLK